MPAFVLCLYGLNVSRPAAFDRNMPHGDAAHCRIVCLHSLVLACLFSFLPGLSSLCEPGFVVSGVCMHVCMRCVRVVSCTHNASFLHLYLQPPSPTQDTKSNSIAKRSCSHEHALLLFFTWYYASIGGIGALKQSGQAKGHNLPL